MRILLISLMLTLAALQASACGGSGKKTVSTPPAVSTATAVATISVTAAPSGQTAVPSQAQIGDLLISVNGARSYTDSNLPAAPGTHYVAVDVTAKNTGEANYMLNLLDFRLEDKESLLHAPAITQGPSPLIGSNESIAAGQSLRGFVVFPLPNGNDPLELQYQASSGASGAVGIPQPSP